MKKLLFVSAFACFAMACNVDNADNPTNNTSDEATGPSSGPDMPVIGEDTGTFKPDSTTIDYDIAADTTAR